MHSVSEMVRSNPSAILADDAELIRCLETCLICAQACSACADACIGDANLTRCARLGLDCADLCEVTMRIASRQKFAEPALLVRMLQLCAAACAMCAEACERHANEHDHCRVCAEACRWCERACRELGAKMPDGAGGVATVGPTRH